jgi:DNA repair protein RecN (Recombination protein N)
MLSHLFIQNYALIRHLDIDFQGGLTVITGETGAGKSILLGALSLILGKRADAHVLLDKNRKCIVEGSFNVGSYDLPEFFTDHDLDYDESTVLRREINKNGKSRAFINDTPVNLSVLKELGEKLIDIHSQHQTITLHDANFQLAVIDSYGGLTREANLYRSLFTELLRKRNKLETLVEQENQARNELDYFQYLFNELEEARLQVDEQTDLENEIEILNHAEEIKTKLYNAVRQMGQDGTNILGQIAEIRTNLNQVSKYSEELSELANRIDSSYIELSEIARDVESVMNTISHNPQKAEEIKDRLDLIYNLENKHHVNSIAKLLEIKQDLSNKLTTISSLQENIEVLKKEVEKAEKKIKKHAENLSISRAKLFLEIEQEIIKDLANLGMPQARFSIDNNRLNQPGKEGIDAIKFLFNANRGGELQELNKVASGGETSRLMLVIKSLISQKNLLPTVIFDEIDMGISGNIADMVGEILVKLSYAMQVIAITHLPQIAGKGDTHYFVYKETEADITKTEIKILQPEDRIIEIAKMVSGQDLTSASVETAKHLLK